MPSGEFQPLAGAGDFSFDPAAWEGGRIRDSSLP
jgi:hypothetical protein